MTILLFFKFVQLHWKTKMQYRGDFILQIFGQVIGYGASYLVIWQLLNRFREIGGWTWPELAFVYSLNLFTYSIGASFTIHQDEVLDQTVISGEFDKYLLKPIHPFIYFTISHFSVGYISHLLLSTVLLIWSCVHLNMVWTIGKMLQLLLFVISSIFLQAAFLILIGSLTFIFIRLRFLFYLYYRLKEFISYPISLFGVTIQCFLTFLFPLAFINYYPSVLILEKDAGVFPQWVGWFALFIGPFFLWLSVIFWMRGVSKYQSAGG